jgi:hypothetical protein
MPFSQEISNGLSHETESKWIKKWLELNGSHTNDEHDDSCQTSGAYGPCILGRIPCATQS